MQKVTLIAVGSVKTPWVREACSDFIMRFPGHCDFSMIEVQASKSKDPHRQSAEESERLLKAAEAAGGMTWLLDERGDRKTSTAFADDVRDAHDIGDHMVFLLGGSYGVNDDVRRAVDRSLRLSDMTLPHELCRAVFLEQLYRAFQIISGGKYHHA